ncbi:single-stranded-DNA-specific exonuclease [Caminicella sporogenes DSM 14501]|uniref:Single-stranded-DNA-specific exonuclease RecJ n=1 Tax=Caminicella sporogenes DSM 14501 TaxID=1121266 RepID=A0A1M6P3R1_9FIRM|nr:single-stranded-DNA-specific exonuclease RecJ [Caminicella sporogenes]RKD21542.1 single-stranded-DNA-specific exonuclease RecJ [Caminicella sporogenes]SHK02533.1 single-stranded-DNA-specific exonuclease [Caminicella sporogenes DSM 14501]
MEKIWNFVGEKIEGLSIVESILYAKGITAKEEIEEFLSDRPKKTYNPFLIKNMKEAVEKILNHLKNNSKIVIFGDYDVDGVTSTALLVEFFSNITNNIDYYIPNRFSEGYGLNKEAIKYIKEEMKGDLIITVDNGVSSFDEVEYAKEIGLDIIVTDHHNPPEKLPECILVDVKQKGDIYPFKELCGCGIAFKLAQALQRSLKLPKNTLSKLLDLVTLATIADIVPLIDENRTLIKYGLRIINSNKRLGLSVLREVVGLKDKEINAGRIGFILAPCFNAAGRLEDAKLGVELLLEKNEERALKLANILYRLNRERQKVQERGEEYCRQLVEKNYMNYDFLVLRADNISEGVIGIVAGKIKDIFYKPTLVVTKTEEGYLKGSGRSIKGINIYEELKKVSDLFIGFGGHEMACGFSLEEDKLDELREKLNFRAKEIKNESPDIFIPKIDIIAEIKPSDLTIDLIEEVSKLEPYGMGNSKPLFAIKNIKVNTKWTRACGNNNIHLKFSGKKDNIFLNGVGFSLAEKYNNLGEVLYVDIAFSPEINEYNGKVSVQMVIEDIKKSEIE